MSLPEQLLDQQVVNATLLQSLWSGYGGIYRVSLADGQQVITKAIACQQQQAHPRGWQTDLGHQRKLRSYEVERYWYQHQNTLCQAPCFTPELLQVVEQPEGVLLVMEDLTNQGFTPLRHIQPEQIKQGLTWLAHFHGQFLHHSAAGLWPQGSYWHLATRPDELNNMAEHPLKEVAQALDDRLKDCPFQTLIHGDAKLANLCWGPRGVAMVDFQYVGKGVPMVDVAYFLSTCLSSNQAFALADDLLDHYFTQLRQALAHHHPLAPIDEIEHHWRGLYSLAWADYCRFLLGWSPDHERLSAYAHSQINQALDQLNA